MMAECDAAFSRGGRPLRTTRGKFFMEEILTERGVKSIDLSRPLPYYKTERKVNTTVGCGGRSGSSSSEYGAAA
jgi:hypothetical protein